MSSRSRKVTIDSGRRISTTGELEQTIPPLSQKKKSVFERLGSSKSKSVVKSVSKSSIEDEYDSEEDSEKTKKSISFTVKKNSLMEDSGNKLLSKKEKKKGFNYDENELVAHTKKKKKKNREIAADESPAYTKPKKFYEPTSEDEYEAYKKSKRMQSPEFDPPTKKKRRYSANLPEDDMMHEMPVVSHKKATKEQKKAKKSKVKESPDVSKKVSKYEFIDEEPVDEEIYNKKKKKKSKNYNEGEIFVEEERAYKPKQKKHRSPSPWSQSEKEEPVSVIRKKKDKTKHQISLSKSPPYMIKEKYSKDYSSFESDVSFESEEEIQTKHKSRKKHENKYKGGEQQEFQNVALSSYRKREREPPRETMREPSREAMREPLRETMRDSPRDIPRQDNYHRQDDYSRHRGGDDHYDRQQVPSYIDDGDDRNRRGSFNKQGGDWQQQSRYDHNRQSDNRQDNSDNHFEMQQRGRGQQGGRGQRNIVNNNNNNRYNDDREEDQGYYRNDRRDNIGSGGRDNIGSGGRDNIGGGGRDNIGGGGRDNIGGGGRDNIRGGGRDIGGGVRRGNDYNTNEWNRNTQYDNDGRRDNDAGNFRGNNTRGRGGRGGRGRGTYVNNRGGYGQYNSDERGGRFQNQPRDVDNRYRKNDDDEERQFDRYNDRYQPKHRGGNNFPRDNEYRDRADVIHSRGETKAFELSPIRDPNLIGALKNDFTDSDDDEKQTKSKSKKRAAKEDYFSASDISEDEDKSKKFSSKNKDKSESNRDKSESNRDKSKEKSKKTKEEDNNRVSKKSRSDTSKERNRSVSLEDLKKHDKKLSKETYKKSTDRIETSGVEKSKKKVKKEIEKSESVRTKKSKQEKIIHQRDHSSDSKRGSPCLDEIKKLRDQAACEETNVPAESETRNDSSKLDIKSVEKPLVSSQENIKQEEEDPQDQSISKEKEDILLKNEKEKDATPDPMTETSPIETVKRVKSPNKKRNKTPDNRMKSPDVNDIRTPEKRDKSVDSKRGKSPDSKRDKSPDIRRPQSPDSKLVKSPESKRSKSPDMKRIKSPDIKRGKSPDIKRVRSPDNKRGRSIETKKGRSPDSRRGKSPDIRKLRSPDGKRVRSPENRRGGRSPDSRRGRSPDARRGRSPERYDRRKEKYNRHAKNRDGSYNRKNSPFNRDESPKYAKNYRSDRSKDRVESLKRGSREYSRGKSPSPVEKTMKGIDLSEDVYETISDDEFAFDDFEDELALPKPASVMEVDWSLLASLNKPPANKGSDDEDTPEFMKKLSPGYMLSEIGYSPSLLSESTLSRVKELCLQAKNIKPDSLEPAEEIKLQNSMAVTVQHIWKQKKSRERLFDQDLIGLRNDLRLRRELRKPMDKIGSRFNLFCSPPSAPVDYEAFKTSVDIFNKKRVNPDDPCYIITQSKVGSYISCKS